MSRTVVTRWAGSIALLALLACAPEGPSPLEHLSGEIVTAPVRDWAFASRLMTIRVETEQATPYSMSLWFVAQGPNLWIYGSALDQTPFAKAVREDGRVRLLIDAKLYERKAVLVASEVEIAKVEHMFYEKYAMRSLSDSAVQPQYFRLDPP